MNRLTKRRGDRVYINDNAIPLTCSKPSFCYKKSCVYAGEKDGCPYLKILYRLAELEDKIESGELAEVADIEQSEGCKFCGTTLYIKTVQYTMPLLAPLTRADELRQELINLTGEIYLPLEVKYCPNCGAKTKGGVE